VSPLLDVPIAFCSVLKGLVMSPGFLSFPVGETYHVDGEIVSPGLTRGRKRLSNEKMSKDAVTFFIFFVQLKVLYPNMPVIMQYVLLYKIVYSYIVKY